MINDQTLDRKISSSLIKERDKRDNGHVSSGKLSASMLGQPLQWQILKSIGVPQRDVDEYTLRKFLRGNHVEDWLLSHMDGIVEKQKFVEYKGAIGYIDAVIDHSTYESKLGIVPHEVKSVTNYKFKRIEKNKEADPQHKLQAAFYALGMGKDHYAIDYVATDDYRVYTMVYEVNGVKKEIDDVIEQFSQARKSKVIPQFRAKYTWQSNMEYCNYPEWLELLPDECMDKLKREYPDSYKKLLNL